MGKQASVVVEWRQCDGEEDWQAAIGAPLAHVRQKTASVAARSGRRVRWQVSSVGIIVLAVVLAGGWRLYQADQVMARVEDDVRAAVAADAYMHQHDGPRLTHPSALPPRFPRLLQVRKSHTRRDWSLGV